MSRNDDMRFYGLYNLVEVKETGRVGMYIGGVLASPEHGGDWMEVRFEDGTHWRYRPDELKRPKRPGRIFDTSKYAFTKSAPAPWRKVWQEWSAENAVEQLMSTLEMYATRQLEPEGPTDGAQSVAGICIYRRARAWSGPGSSRHHGNGPGSEEPSIDSTFA